MLLYSGAVFIFYDIIEELCWSRIKKFASSLQFDLYHFLILFTDRNTMIESLRRNVIEMKVKEIPGKNGWQYFIKWNFKTIILLVYKWLMIWVAEMKNN